MDNNQWLADCEDLAIKIGAQLLKKQAMLATAESCTGGWISEMITSVPGSSAWFDRGFVTYSNVAKQEMLGVLPLTLATQGAVSSAIAIEMAKGALAHSQADFSLSVTGIAGPTGGTPEKPVGLVWFAWAEKGLDVQTAQQLFKGNRYEIRLQSVHFGLTHLLKILYHHSL